MDWEWSTGVFVVKEGNFTRSEISEVDEAEIFGGQENKLTMVQTYTWMFQCEYKLQKYPFDTQVNVIEIQRHGFNVLDKIILVSGMCNHNECGEPDK